MNCPAHLGSPTGLACVLPEGHAWGHTYHSTSGIPDRHDKPGGGDE